MKIECLLVSGKTMEVQKMFFGIGSCNILHIFFDVLAVVEVSIFLQCCA